MLFVNSFPGIQIINFITILWILNIKVFYVYLPINKPIWWKEKWNFPIAEIQYFIYIYARFNTKLHIYVMFVLFELNPHRNGWFYAKWKIGNQNHGSHQNYISRICITLARLIMCYMQIKPQRMSVTMRSTLEAFNKPTIKPIFRILLGLIYSQDTGKGKIYVGIFIRDVLSVWF